MSHAIYTTKGFIISSENRSEADKTFFIFTEDFGFVRASASGVRKIESKLRYSLQDFSFSQFSLVIGKTGWRIVNAESIDSFNNVSRNKIKVSALRLLKKLCGEDEAHGDLFKDLMLAFNFIDTENIKEDEGVEALLVLKILSHLGYWGNTNENNFVLSPFNQESIIEIKKKKKEIIKEVNQSLKATHLL